MSLYAAAPGAPHVSLAALFDEINRAHFDGFLEPPVLLWNSRLATCAGRFFPGRRWLTHRTEPKIEIASYLLKKENAMALVTDTLAHEMIHYWLWVRRRPYGHTAEFLAKMRIMGVSRYNTVPMRRPPRYLYLCPSCSKEFPAHKRLKILACGQCCKAHSGGKYDPRFRLYLDRQLTPEEGQTYLK